MIALFDNLVVYCLFLYDVYLHHGKSLMVASVVVYFPTKIGCYRWGGIDCTLTNMGKPILVGNSPTARYISDAPSAITMHHLHQKNEFFYLCVKIVPQSVVVVAVRALEPNVQHLSKQQLFAVARA